MRWKQKVTALCSCCLLQSFKRVWKYLNVQLYFIICSNKVWSLACGLGLCNLWGYLDLPDEHNSLNLCATRKASLPGYPSLTPKLFRRFDWLQNARLDSNKSLQHTTVMSSLKSSWYPPFISRYNPVREAEDTVMPTTEDIWKQLHDKIMNSFSSVKQAFLFFDDVSAKLILYKMTPLMNNSMWVNCSAWEIHIPLDNVQALKFILSCGNTAHLDVTL